MSNAYNLITQKINLWLKEFIKLLPNILIAAVILVIGFFAGKPGSEISQKVLYQSIS